MTLNVPVSLTSIPSAIGSFRVGCSLSAAKQTPVFAAGSSPAMPLNGSFSGTVSVPITQIADAYLAGLTSLVYGCRVQMFSQPPTAFGPLGPANADELTQAQYAALLVQPTNLYLNATLELGPKLRTNNAR
jgi:hypothetical protein